MKAQHVRVSKFLSLVLRHQPEKVGVTLDREGWVSVSALLEALGAHGLRLTPDELREVVRSRLAHYKCPTSVEFRDGLERTATGKLQKFKMREAYWAGRNRQVN